MVYLSRQRRIRFEWTLIGKLGGNCYPVPPSRSLLFLRSGDVRYALPVTVDNGVCVAVAESAPPVGVYDIDLLYFRRAGEHFDGRLLAKRSSVKQVFAVTDSLEENDACGETAVIRIKTPSESGHTTTDVYEDEAVEKVLAFDDEDWDDYLRRKRETLIPLTADKHLDRGDVYVFTGDIIGSEAPPQEPIDVPPAMMFVMTQEEYDALEVKEAKLYCITERGALKNMYFGEQLVMKHGKPSSPAGFPYSFPIVF